MGRKKLWAFVGGVASGLVLVPIVKSKTARKAAVVYAEARQKASEGDGPADEDKT